MRTHSIGTPGSALDSFVKTTRREIRALQERVAGLSRRVTTIESSGIQFMSSEPAEADKENGMVWLDGGTVVFRSNDADVPL